MPREGRCKEMARVDFEVAAALLRGRPFAVEEVTAEVHILTL